MATRYKKYADDPQEGAFKCIQKIEDNGDILCVPFVQENTDYQEYLEWVKAGNTPEEAS